MSFVKLLIAQIMLLAALMCSAYSEVDAEADIKIKAVASFSILGDMVKNIGKDRLELSVLVGPNSDGHVFQPTPQDAKQLARADILFTNGLGFEGWIERLVEASGFKGQKIIATQGITPLNTQADQPHGAAATTPDPHAWQNLINARIYATNITHALSVRDPGHKAFYQANLVIYIEKIAQVEREIIAAIATIPPVHRRVITSHDAFKYFEAAYSLRFDAPQGISTSAEASATEVAALIRQIRAEKIPALFLENITDSRLIEQIKRETHTVIGGTLYSDALSEDDKPANTYLNLMQHNARVLVGALAPLSSVKFPSARNKVHE